MASTYSDVAIDELRACIAQAYDEFTQRWGHAAGTPSLVAHMGTILFEQRLADLDAGKRTPSILRLRGLLDEMKRTRSLSEKSFHGDKRPQIILETRLRKLRPYVLQDGRVLTIIGPEFSVVPEMHLYLDFAVGSAPRTTAKIAALASTPADEHTARVRRLANAIAQLFERMLLRRSPKEVEEMEKTARKRGLRYALIGLFFPLACAGVYYYVTNLDAHAVAFAPKHLHRRTATTPRLIDLPMVTLVRWNDDGPIRPPYEIYKNGKLVATTTVPYFLDRHPMRDNTPDVERITDHYRVGGRLWRFLPRITPRIPTEDRVLPNFPCLVRDEAQLCVELHSLDVMLSMPLSEFSEPPVRIALVGEEHTLNLTSVFIEPQGSAVDPRRDRPATTRIVTDGIVRGNGDTVTYKPVFTHTGLVDYRNVGGPRDGKAIQRYTVITKEQLRNRALLNQKLNSYADPDVFAVTVMDTPVVLPDKPRGAPMPSLPWSKNGLLTRPQIVCTRWPGRDTLSIAVYPTSCKPGECEVEMDYEFVQTTLENVSTEPILTEEKSGLAWWLLSYDYSLSPSEEYVDNEMISAWVYRVENGQRKLVQVIRKKVTLPGRRATGRFKMTTIHGGDSITISPK